MPELPKDVLVNIFDPATPFERIAVKSSGIDTWHDYSLIRKDLREKLINISSNGKHNLDLSGGMHMTVPMFTIGAQIGSIRFANFEVLEVDDGSYDILFGKNIFNLLFSSQIKSKGKAHADVEFSTSAKDDANALALEIFPVEYPFAVINLEKFIRDIRMLHNINLIALGQIQTSGLPESAIDLTISQDEGIPERLKLKISTVDHGSIWISLKSGSVEALKYVGTFFQQGATSKLSQEMAEAHKNQNDAQISKETRDAVVKKVLTENEKLSANNIHETYEAFRKECRARLQFLDDLIEQVPDPQVKDILRKKKTQVVMEMADQQLVPIVRNTPGSYIAIKGENQNYFSPPK